MNVFISWSGERSKRVAELLDEWLKCVIQAIDPWMSSKDIDRGALWFTEISGQLANTSIGIVCLTKENKNKPWILFESGALAKGISSNRVLTLLIDLAPSDLESPLSQFNHSFPDKDGIYKLVSTINAYLGDKALNKSILEKVFETYWSQFEENFNQILKDVPEGEIEDKRSSNDLLNEVLMSVRAMDSRLRNLETKNRPIKKATIEKVSDENSKEPRNITIWENIGNKDLLEYLRNATTPATEFSDKYIDMQKFIRDNFKPE
jgi:hypothetical protein